MFWLTTNVRLLICEVCLVALIIYLDIDNNKLRKQLKGYRDQIESFIDMNLCLMRERVNRQLQTNRKDTMKKDNKKVPGKVRVDVIKEMLKDGKSTKEISKKLNLSTSYINKIIKHHNLKGVK